MIKSMTGFGRGRYSGESFACAVEIRSVNHRFLDPHIRLPSELASLELRIRRLIQSKIKRGRIDLAVTLERNPDIAFFLNTSTLQAYLTAIEKLKNDFFLSGEVDLVQLLRIPGILNFESASLSPGIQDLVHQGITEATEIALQDLDRMRMDEGETLKVDILKRLDSIDCEVERIGQQMQGSLMVYQERLRTRLNEILAGAAVDPARIVQEAAFYVERSDITEEVTRLQSHSRQCRTLLNSGDEVGKTLDFLLQEMNREANTILSKTTGLTGNGLEIASAAIVIKTEVEKIREQIQNVE
jgi:uncharacterized protein (TIGR00255 family)